MRASACEAGERNGQVGERPVRAHDRGDRRGAPGPGRRGPGDDRGGPSCSRTARRSSRRASRCSRRAGFLELSLGDAAAAERTLDRLAEQTHATGSSIRRSSATTATRSRRRSRSATATKPSGCSRSWSSSAARLERRLAAGDRRSLPRAAVLGAGRAGGGLPRARGGARAPRAPRRAVRAGAHAARARQRAAARPQEAPGPRVAGGCARIFERLGAALWAERARGELARVGGRATTAELTATEERVAELLASGLTYRQAADALFVSPKTVQWNVSKIYRKLGITTRGELIKHLDDGTSSADRLGPRRSRRHQSQPDRPLSECRGGA